MHGEVKVVLHVLFTSSRDGCCQLHTSAVIAPVTTLSRIETRFLGHPAHSLASIKIFCLLRGKKELKRAAYTGEKKPNKWEKRKIRRTGRQQRKKG
jgi:hypothetical protein